MPAKTIGQKFEVFRGTAMKTSGGLVKSDLTKSKSGKIVSKLQLAAGKRLASRFPPNATRAKPFSRSNQPSRRR